MFAFTAVDASCFLGGIGYVCSTFVTTTALITYEYIHTGVTGSRAAALAGVGTSCEGQDACVPSVAQ